MWYLRGAPALACNRTSCGVSSHSLCRRITMDSSLQARPRLPRNPQACSECRRKKIRCVRGEDGICQPCRRSGLPCQMQPPRTVREDAQRSSPADLHSQPAPAGGQYCLETPVSSCSSSLNKDDDISTQRQRAVAVALAQQTHELGRMDSTSGLRRDPPGPASDLLLSDRSWAPHPTGSVLDQWTSIPDRYVTSTTGDLDPLGLPPMGGSMRGHHWDGADSFEVCSQVSHPAGHGTTCSTGPIFAAADWQRELARSGAPEASSTRSELAEASLHCPHGEAPGNGRPCRAVCLHIHL